MALATAPTAAHATKGAAPVSANAFTKASKQKTETFLDVSRTLGASAITLNQIDVPATGYLRHLFLVVTVTGATAATGYLPDAPWNVIQSMTFRDVNGMPLHVLSGYDLMLANLFGAYTQHADPLASPLYTETATGFTFALRVPVEIISRGALGCLENSNAAMTYKLSITLAPTADVFIGATASPTVEIKGTVESWSKPSPTDLRGTPNITTPPALGVTQNWSEHVAPITVGQNTIRLPRVGNAIRNLVLVCRDASGARANNFPSELGIYFDGNQWHKASADYFRARAYELFDYPAASLPLGVLVLPYDFDFDGTPGEEVGDFWVQTSGATRFEIQGVFPVAGSLMVLTNDVLAVAAPGGAGATLGAQG